MKSRAVAGALALLFVTGGGLAYRNWSRTPDLPSEPVDLESSERKVFSQFGEDGVIEKIFEIIEPTHRYAVEFGARDGIRGSNVRNLILEHGWGGLQIEGAPRRARELAANYRGHPKVTTLEAWVWPGNVEILFEENGVPRDLDFLVIDIDSNDYYVWRALHDFRPKVVMMEANGAFPPPQKMVIDFHPMNYWDGTVYSGASLQSLYELGKKKGYELIYHMKSGVNAFFVDRQYYARFGLRDNSPEALFNPVPVEIGAGFDSPGGPLIPPDKQFLIWKDLRIKKRFIFDR